jgi:succinylglutamate desuccinylase
MLQIKRQLPQGLLSAAPTELADLLGSPTLFHLDGLRQPAVFISVLLHGNETTGFEAIKRVLAKYKPGGGERPLPRSLSLFIGNVEAAAKGQRRLDGQPDFNRIWLSVEAPETAESRMMVQIVNEMRKNGVFLSLDFHNNTGLNPHYACINRLDHRFLQLATLYSRMVTYFRAPQGVQSLAFSEFCTSTTVECGPIGQEYGIQHAAEFMDACLHLSHLPDHQVAAHDLDLFHTIARVTLVPEVSFSFDGTEADLMFVPEIDHLNFTELQEGKVIGQLRKGVDMPLLAIDETGQDVTKECFQVLDQVIYAHRKFMPSMLTKDGQIIRQDCFCYLMERISVPPESVWKMPQQAAQ